MAMLKNKKKLRRLARMTSGGFAGRALLTLAVAGMLAVPSMAGAATQVLNDTYGTGSKGTLTITTDAATNLKYADSVLTILDTDAKIATDNVVIGLGKLTIGSGTVASVLTVSGAHTLTLGVAGVAGTPDGTAGVLDIVSGAKFVQNSTGLVSVGAQGFDDESGKGGDGTVNVAGTLDITGGHVNIGGTGGSSSGATAGGMGGAGKLNFTAGDIKLAANQNLLVGGVGGANSSMTAGHDGGKGGAGDVLVTAGADRTLSINTGKVLIGGAGGTGESGAGGAGGAGLLSVAADSILTIKSTADTGSIQIGGIGGAGATSGAGGDGTMTVAGTLNVDATNSIGITVGGSGATAGVGTASISGEMNVNVADAKTATITMSGAVPSDLMVTGSLNIDAKSTSGTGTFAVAGGGITIGNKGVVSVASNGVGIAALTAAGGVDVNTGGMLNLYGDTAVGSNGATVDTVVMNGGELNAFGGESTGATNTIGTAFSFGASGGMVNVGNADNAKSLLTITPAVDIINGGIINVNNGSTFTATDNTTLTKGELNLAGGSTHKGTLDFAGADEDDAVVTATGGSATAFNHIEGAISTSANGFGSIAVGDAGYLKVTGAVALGNADNGVDLTIADDSFMWLTSTLAINFDSEVTTSSLSKGTAAGFGTKSGLIVDGVTTIANGGTLNILGDHTWNTTDLVLTDGTLRVAGELSTAAALAVNQDVVAQKYKSTNVAADTLADGFLTLTGTGTLTDTVLTRSTGDIFTVSTGTLNLGGDAKDLAAMKLAAGFVQGGALGKDISLTGTGVMNVFDGDWTSTGTMTVDNTSGTGLTVSGGSLSGNKLIVSGTGDVLVGNGSQVTQLIVTGTTSGSLTNVAYVSGTGIVVDNLGELHATQGALFDDATPTLIDSIVKKMLVNAGGSIVIDGIAAGSKLTLDQMNAAQAALLDSTSKGLVNFGSIGISNLPATVKYTDVAGLMSDQLLNTTVTVASGDLANISGGFKNLSLDPAIITDTTITTTGTLQLAGGAAGTELVAGLAKDKKATIAVAADSALTFGKSLGTGTEGNLTGSVTLTNGTGGGANTIFNVINGKFSVTGDITGAANTAINLHGAMLNVAGNVTGGSILNVNNGGLSGATVTVGEVNLASGSIISTGKATSAAATLGDMTTGNIITGAIADGAKRNVITAGNSLTVAAFADGIVAADGSVANTNITTGKDMTVTTGGIDATGVNLTVNGTLTTTDGADIFADEGSIFDVKELNTSGGGTFGVISADGASTFKIGTLDMSKTGNVLVMEGSSMTVDTFSSAAGKSINIGDATDTKGSALTIGSLTSSATASTFIIAPAGDKGILQVKAINSAAGSNNMNDIMIADANSILSFGAHDKAWTEAQMKMAGSTASSVLVIGMPVKMGAIGQIIVDSKYDSALVPGIDYAALDVRGDSLIIADLAGMRNADGTFSGIQLNAGDGIVNIDTTAGLRLTGDDMRAGQSYTLVSGISDTVDSVTQSDATTPGIADKGALTLNGGKSSNYLLVNVGDIIYNHGATANNGTLTVNTSLVHASTVLPRLSGSTAGFLDNMAVNTGFNSHSSNAGVRFVSRALDRDFIGINDVDLAAATIEGATQTAAVAGVQGSTFSIANASSGVAATRTSFAQPLMDTSRAVAVLQDSDNNLSLDGLSAGNGMNNGFGLWVMPMYQADRVSGMKAGSFKSGYNSDFGGVVLGADYTFDNAWRIGAAFNVGAGHASSKGDFNKTKNNFEFWGISMYGGWTMNNFGISADLGYTSTSNDVKQALPFAMGMDSLKSKADSSAWTVGAKAEYKLETSVMEIVPYIGVRYMGLNTSSYDAKSAGQTVFNVGSHDQSVFTFPIGVNLSKTIETGSGWKVRPQAQLGVIPAVGDLKTRSTSTIPGIAGSMTNTMNVVDSFTFDGGVGLDVIKDNLSFGVKYNIQASQHRTGHGVFGTLRYEY